MTETIIATMAPTIARAPNTAYQSLSSIIDQLRQQVLHVWFRSG